MNPRPFYNKTAMHYNTRHASDTTKAIRRRESRLLGKFCTGRILDLGCGTGYHLGMFENIVGLDISDEMIKLAKTKGRPVVMADAKQMPFRDASFDTIISIFNVMDRHDFTKTVAEASHVLKPGGHFLLSIASFWDNEYGFMEKVRMKRSDIVKRKTFHVSGTETSLDLYEKPEIESIFRKNGMETAYFDSIFIWQNPNWGNLKPFSLAAKIRLLLERLLPKKYGCMYFFAFRKSKPS